MNFLNHLKKKCSKWVRGRKMTDPLQIEASPERDGMCLVNIASFGESLVTTVSFRLKDKVLDHFHVHIFLYEKNVRGTSRLKYGDKFFQKLRSTENFRMETF